MAFLTFGRRKRRKDDEHDCDGSDAGELHQPGGALAGYVVDESGALIPADEVHLPRWRRPSLMAARRATPAVSPDELVASRLTFDHASVTPEPMHERRRIRYRMVRVGDRPDEILGAEIGRLDQGDEVELLESRGAFWKIRVPTGLIGWIHRTTLAEPARFALPDGAQSEPWQAASSAPSGYGASLSHDGSGGSHDLPGGNHGYGTSPYGNGAAQHAGDGLANVAWPHPNGHNGNGGFPGTNHSGWAIETIRDGAPPNGNHGSDASPGSRGGDNHTEGVSELAGLSNEVLAARLAAAEAMLADTVPEGDVTEGLAARLIRERQRGTPH